jgi:hypothetical protein
MNNGSIHQERGYDTATVREENGAARSLARAEYEKLPLAERIRLVLENRVEFYRGGTLIPAREALRVSSAG